MLLSVYVMKRYITSKNPIQHISNYDECIIFTPKYFINNMVDNLISFVDLNTKRVFNICQTIYLIVPITNSTFKDYKYNNIRIIRIFYSKPELFATLLPLNTDSNVDEILIIEVKKLNENKMIRGVKEYIKIGIYEDMYIKIKEYSLHQLRYFWLYLGLDFVEKHFTKITKYDRHYISQYMKKYQKELKYTKCISPYKNEDMTMILRFQRRSNEQHYIDSFKFYDDSLKIVSIVQNNLYIKVYQQFKEIKKNFIFNMFWCSNWNSLFFFSRLIPLLYNTKYIMWCDDDTLFKYSEIGFMKYTCSKYNAMVSIYGEKKDDQIEIKYNNTNYKFNYAKHIYGTAFFQTQWQVHLWRFKTYYKKWGDDIISEVIAQYECNVSLLLDSTRSILQNLYDFKVATYAQNASMYIKGQKIMYPIIDNCTKVNKPDSREKCFYPAYI